MYYPSFKRHATYSPHPFYHTFATISKHFSCSAFFTSFMFISSTRLQYTPLPLSFLSSSHHHSPVFSQLNPRNSYTSILLLVSCLSYFFPKQFSFIFIWIIIVIPNPSFAFLLLLLITRLSRFTSFFTSIQA